MMQVKQTVNKEVGLYRYEDTLGTLWHFNNKPSGEVKLKSGLSLYTDLGITFSIAERTSQYLGGYLDYGITNIAISQEDLPFGSTGIYTSIIEVSGAVNKILPVSYGVKIGISLGIKGKSKEGQQ